LKDQIKQNLEEQEDNEAHLSHFEARLKLAKEEGIRQGRREGIMDNKLNEVIEKYKREIEEQGEQIVNLETSKERLESELNRLRNDLRNAEHQIAIERNLQKSLSKEVEELTMEVKTMKQNLDYN
jgi:chromosome segregation ATPase